MNKTHQKILHELFGKGNFKVTWNHGGNSLFVKKICLDGKKHFVMYAYDYENWVKKVMACGTWEYRNTKEYINFIENV